jgi:hypothetical protein
MASRLAGHLTRTHDEPRRAPIRSRERPEDRGADHWSPTAKGLAVLGVAAAAAVVVAGVYYLPDFLRYMKIRRM